MDAGTPASQRTLTHRETLLACESGRELAAQGYPQDVESAAQLDVSACVPVLTDGAFVALCTGEAPGAATWSAYGW